MRPERPAVDWPIIAAYGLFALALGSFFTKKASRGVESFFVGDRKLPWWVAGTSIVATTFAADTPLAVTGLVALGGISGNWIWWCWGIAHVVATFFFARLWRRSGVITDAEITELRYSGRVAAALRGFKAVYFGIFINCLTMAWVIAAMVKISAAFFDVEPAWVIIACVAFSVTYTTLGGFRSVVVTDLVQFCLGMGGAILIAYLAVSHFGGIGATGVGSDGEAAHGLLGRLAEVTEEAGGSLSAVLDFVPAPDHPQMPLVVFAVLLIAGWWRYAEGNGYIVQRLAACKDEGHAQAASLWFSVAHNALRPWPWILVGLAALIIYPRLAGEAPPQLVSEDGQVTVTPASIDVVTGGLLTITGAPAGAVLWVDDQRAVLEPGENGALVARFGPLARSRTTELRIESADPESATGRWTIRGLRVELTDREMGYPLLMGRFLPTGVLGLVIASLLAAFMSTIDTHTNWGASYLVRDLYQRFIRPDASERHYVLVSRLCIVGMALLAGVTALFVHNIAEVWRFLITLGAGLGSVAAARWYWSRVTPQAEFAALGVTTVLAIGLLLFSTPQLFGGPNPFLFYEVPGWTQIIIIAGASLATWVPVSLFGPRNDPQVLRAFAALVRPPGPGWPRTPGVAPDPLWPTTQRFAVGLVVLYGSLFGLGQVILGSLGLGLALLAVVAVLLAWIIRGSRAAA